MPSGYLKTLDGTRIEIVDAKAREDIETLNSGKVDAETGKSLSTNDYDNAAKAKVDAIPSNPKYTDTVYDDTEVRTQISGKLTEPESGIVAGKYFKVKSVDKDGHAVLEAVDLPLASGNGTTGMVKIQSSNGIFMATDGLAINRAYNSNIDGRSGQYLPITAASFDYAVKAALTDGVGMAYTTTQQESARSRLGAASASDVETISTNYVKASDVSDVETVPEDVHDVRVNGTSIVENGVANIPVAGESVYGAVKCDNTYGTYVAGNNPSLRILKAVDSEINTRTSAYRPIVPANLDYAVKASLSDSNCKVTWTDAEKKAACDRIGAEYYPDFTYKGTLSTGTQWLEVDLTGCTELVLDGVATTNIATTSLVSICPKNSGIISLPCSSTKTCKLKYYAKDVSGIMATMYYRTATSTAVSYMTTVGVSYDYVDLSISDIVKIGFESSYFSKMESYSIAVYAR